MQSDSGMVLTKPHIRRQYARGQFLRLEHEQNRQLIEQQRVSCETVVSAMEQDALLDVLVHPNQDRHPGQYIHVVAIQAYVHLVPFVIQPNGTRFLKTIIPSRKATREYRRRQP